MSTVKIAVFVGSLRAASFNLQLARALEKLVPAHVKFDYVSLGDIPLFNQDIEDDMPAPAAKMKQQIVDAQAVLFVTPEHNRSIPAALKNAIDWGTRPWGKNVWAGKTGGLLGTSPSAAGTGMAQQHLRNVLAAEGVNLLTTPEVFMQWKEGQIDADGNITNDGTRKFLQGWVDNYIAWIERLAK
ncbi:NADPH-dependent FMN reductase [Bordetella genomosp. 5]|uniref:NADPH-dependent FMN reductase n=1 Tax=Bordetella genomosp. 5 TaxID=1395608 RepID=A0A261TAF6_9BORD|nr:NADPH-dependent FMN reductase [Bordetella genomosp. 5]OZI39864.1 NADPH-dependent FMN reductase [Bordetella genomosp. 5]OZI46618.1 NADPH-dependent FMN reductase [Bordetella genomosp. 5]